MAKPRANIERALFSALCFLVPFLAVFCGCSPEKHGWACDSSTSSDANRYAILYLPPENAFRNLEVELQKDTHGTRVYLNVYSQPLIPDASGKIDLIMKVADNGYRFKAQVLEGQQRLMLPTEAEALFLDAVRAKKPLAISVGRYHSVIHYECFEEELKKFN